MSTVRTFANIDRFAGVMTLLIAKPRTIDDLHQALGMRNVGGNDGVRELVRALHVKGALHICSWRKAYSLHVPVFAMQTTIDEFDDVPPPAGVRVPRRRVE